MKQCQTVTNAFAVPPESCGYLREAVGPSGEKFCGSSPYRYVILDRDGKYGREVTDLLTASGIKPVRTSLACPWQNGIAERWIESCRRDLLDHVIVLNDGHFASSDA